MQKFKQDDWSLQHHPLWQL